MGTFKSKNEEANKKVNVTLGNFIESILEILASTRPLDELPSHMAPKNLENIWK